MAEDPTSWPRCHTCLYNWCPAKRDDCERCDAVLAILRQTAERASAAAKRVADDARVDPDDMRRPCTI